MFNFPQISKPSGFHYKNNFLKSVSFQLNFDPVSISDDVLFTLKEKLSSTYVNVEKVIQGKVELSAKGFVPEPYSTHGLAFSTPDGLLNLTITRGQISYIIKGAAYKNYESFSNNIQSEINIIKDQLKITTISRIAIRKVNILNFHVNESGDQFSLVDVLSLIFNSKLVDNMKVLPTNNYLKKGLNTMVLNNQEHWLNLTYGLVVDGSDSTVANGVLDIDLYIQGQRNIDSLFSDLEKINNEIYNIFCWALQNETRNRLNE